MQLVRNNQGDCKNQTPRGGRKQDVRLAGWCGSGGPHTDTATRLEDSHEVPFVLVIAIMCEESDERPR